MSIARSALAAGRDEGMPAAPVYDLAAVGSHFPSLLEGTAFFNGAAGTQVADVEADAGLLGADDAYRP
ncbi:hypothetical protein ACWC5F_32075 [Streptomyces sp. NPDC001272]